MVLTAEGRIFGWGRGSFGRLGTGLEKDCHSPVEVFLPGLPLYLQDSACSAVLPAASLPACACYTACTCSLLDLTSARF